MTLRHLKIFIAVYETLSFTKAGEQIHLAQPSISLAIKELEEHFKVRLFDRIKHTIYPTESGEKLYEYATQIINTYEEMQKNVTDFNGETTLNIGSSITIGINVLPTLLKIFQETHPNIKVNVVINNSITIERYLLLNKIDIALIENKATHHQIKTIPFMSDDLCTIANPKHPLARKKNIKLSELTQENFLMREEGSSVRSLVESVFTSKQVVINPTWVSTSSQALIKAVRKNLGITTLPYQLVYKEIKEGKLVVLDVGDLKINRQYNIIYHKGKYLTKAIEEFFVLCTVNANIYRQEL